MEFISNTDMNSICIKILCGYKFVVFIDSVLKLPWNSLALHDNDTLKIIIRFLFIFFNFSLLR